MDPRSPTTPPPTTEPRRFGLRARLLALPLPGIIALLALDSRNDYRALPHPLCVTYVPALP